MRPPLRLAALALALISATTPGLLAQVKTLSPFVVGIWSYGDAILPFADFDGRRWRSNWPAPMDTSSERPESAGPIPDPPTIQAIPARWWGSSTFQPTWEVIGPDGRSQIVSVTGTTLAGMGSGCSMNFGLKTNAPPDPVPDAIAANRAGVLEAVQRLTSNTPEWQTLTALLPDIYRRYEADGWKDAAETSRPNLSGALARPQLERAFVSTDDLGQFVYFESHREFESQPGRPFPDRSLVTGWLWRRSTETPFQLVTVERGHGDDEKGRISFAPLAIVRSDVRRFWIGSSEGYAYSDATVVEVSRAGVRAVVTVAYPGC